MRKLRYIVGCWLLAVSGWLSAQDQLMYDQYNDLSFYNPAVSNVDGNYKHYVQAWTHAAFAPGDYIERYKTQTYEDYESITSPTVPSSGYLKELSFDNSYGFIPKAVGGSATTYVGDYFYTNNNQANMLLLGGKLDVQAPWLKKFQMTPDFDLGIQYRLRGLRLGVAVVNIAGNSAANNTALIMYERRGYMNVSYDFLLGAKKNIMLSPHLLFYLGQHTASADMGLDLNLWRYAHVGYTFRMLEMRHVVTAGFEYKGFTLDLASELVALGRKERLQVSLGYKF